MHRSIRITFLLLALAVTDTALAQQTIVYTVDGWGAKASASSFQWGVTTPASAALGAAGAGKPSVQDSILTFPIGDAAVRFAQAAMRGEHLRTVLVEFPLARGNPNGPAPFAIRLTDVLVTAVSMAKGGSDGGPGVAEVKLNASRVELFSAQQDPKGSVQPSSKTGYDVRTGKAL